MSGQQGQLQLTVEPACLSGLHPFHRDFEVSCVLGEALDELDRLHETSHRGVSGGGPYQDYVEGDLTEAPATYQDGQLVISGQQVVQSWERPIMERMARMARMATRSGGDVLEVGFGMGMSANAIIANGVRSYTLIECNPDVLRHAESWRAQHPDQDITIVPGRWQDVLDELGSFDAIAFDTYPLNEAEMEEEYSTAVPAEEVLPHSVAHLRPGGMLTYPSGEIASLARRHQRTLLEHFSSVEVSVVRDLHPSENCNYYWATSMVTVAATL